MRIFSVSGYFMEMPFGIEKGWGGRTHRTKKAIQQIQAEHDSKAVSADQQMNILCTLVFNRLLSPGDEYKYRYSSKPLTVSGY
jgi:hypothetical protein